MSDRPQRLHDLDALRATAMSLGIVLHAIFQFVPYRPVGNSADEVLGATVELIHGFRLPLFFLLSGYFMAMLVARRGLARTVGQRALRIGVPFGIAVLTIIPLLDWTGTKVYTWIITEGRFDFSRAVEDSGNDEIDLAHLWFLWFLLIYVALFAILVLIARGVRSVWPRLVLPRWLGTVAILVLFASPVITEATTAIEEFGPPTENSWTPGIGILTYYLAFYFFGALLYGRSSTDAGPAISRPGRRWPILLGVGIGGFYPIGVGVTSIPVISAIAQVAYAWVMAFGLIGLFRMAFAKERFWVRYASDSSYWLYVVHLPVVFALQGVFTFTDWPGVVEAALITVLTVSSMLIVYAVAVRYTPLGWLLNGRRTLRDDARALRGGVPARPEVKVPA